MGDGVCPRLSMHETHTCVASMIKALMEGKVVRIEPGSESMGALAACLSLLNLTRDFVEGIAVYSGELDEDDEECDS